VQLLLLPLLPLLQQHLILPRQLRLLRLPPLLHHLLHLLHLLSLLPLLPLLLRQKVRLGARKAGEQGVDGRVAALE